MKNNQSLARIPTPTEQEMESHENEDDNNYGVIIEKVVDSEGSEDTQATTDDDADYIEIFDSNIIPYPPVPPPWSQARIREIRDGLLKQKGTHLIFVYLNETPYDSGAKLYQEANLLPKYKDLTYERARICTVKGNTVIALPIKYNNQTLVEAQNLKNCLCSLVDVITELTLFIEP